MWASKVPRLTVFVSKFVLSVWENKSNYLYNYKFLRKQTLLIQLVLGY